MGVLTRALLGRSPSLHRPAFDAHKESSKELFDTSFNAVCNLLIEVVVLTVAFLVFFAGYQERAISEPIAQAVYDSRKDDLAQATHTFLKTDLADLPKAFSRLAAEFGQVPDGVVPAVPGVPQPAEDGADGSFWVWDPLRLNDGATWRELGGFPPMSLHSAAVLPGTEEIVMLGGNTYGTQRGNDGDNIWRSLNRGMTWRRAGRIDVKEREHTPMVVTPRGILVVLRADQAILRSADGGMTWQQMVSAAEAPWRNYKNSGTAGAHWERGTTLAVDASGAVLVFAANYSQGVRVWRSADDGSRDSWFQWSSDGPTMMAWGVNHQPGFQTRIYHMSFAGLPNGHIVGVLSGVYSTQVNTFLSVTYRSTDGGRTWDIQNRDPPFKDRVGWSLVYVPQWDSLLLMGGWRWSTTLNNSTLDGAVFQTRRDLNDVWRSVDEGRTWTLLNRNAPWEPRAYTGVAVVGADLLVIGGEVTVVGSAGTVVGADGANDVWRLRNIGRSLASEARTAEARTAEARTAESPGASSASSASSAAVEIKTRTLQRILLSLADPDPENNTVATHNLWVKRAALILMVMGLVAGLVGVLVYRVAIPKAADRVNLRRILLLNLIIFAGTFAIQAGFMLFFTLRYVPIKPSLQLESIRESFNRRVDDAIRAQNPEGVPGDPPAQDFIPREALLSNGALLLMLLLVVAVVWAAWKHRAFHKVSLPQAGLVGCLVVGVVIFGMYFFIQRFYAPKIVERVGDELSKAVVERAAAAFPDPGELEDVRGKVDQVLGEAVADMERTTNVEAARSNFRLLITTGSIAGIFVLVLVGAIVLLQVIRNRKLPRDQRQSWAGFLLALLLVGLVAGTTSVMVEYGFANNVLSNYISGNPGKIINNTVANLNTSIYRHKEWFQQRRCAGEAECPPAVKNRQSDSRTYRYDYKCARGEEDEEAVAAVTEASTQPSRLSTSTDSLQGHDVACPEGSVLTRLRFVNDYAAGQQRFDYACRPGFAGAAGQGEGEAAQQLRCRDVTTAEANSGDGNAIYLDRHDVSCAEDEAMSRMQLTKPTPSTIQYSYRCCKAPAGRPPFDSAEARDTGFNDEGDGDLRFLDRHDIDCGGSAIQGLQMKRRGIVGIFANQLSYVGPGTNYGWYSPKEPQPGLEDAECTLRKSCDLCCDLGPYTVRDALDTRARYRAARINAPPELDQDAMRTAEVATTPCLLQPGTPARTFPRLAPGQNVADWSRDIWRDCSPWDRDEGTNTIWRRHVPLDI